MSMVSERIVEVAKISHISEDSILETLIAVSFWVQQGDSVKGKVRLYKLIYSQKKKYEF